MKRNETEGKYEQLAEISRCIDFHDFQGYLNESHCKGCKDIDICQRIRDAYSSKRPLVSK